MLFYAIWMNYAVVEAVDKARVTANLYALEIQGKVRAFESLSAPP